MMSLVGIVAIVDSVYYVQIAALYVSIMSVFWNYVIIAFSLDLIVNTG